MIIRELENKDLPEVESIYDLYWSGNFRENLSKRLKGYIENSPDITEQGFKYFTAEENEKIEGIIGIRKCPVHMLEYAKSSNSVEIYIVATKDKQQGVGRLLIDRALVEAKNLGYTEAILYSGETHADSWGFYDHLNFERTNSSIAPNGERGQIWRMNL